MNDSASGAEVPDINSSIETSASDRGSLLGIIAGLARSSFLQGTALLFFATSFVNAGNYLFNVVAGRALGPEPYGALTSVISLLYVVSIPAVALQTLTAREVAGLTSAHSPLAADAVIRRIQKWALIFAMLVFFLFTALSLPLKSFLDLGSPLPFLVIGVGAAASIMVSVLRGVLQGRTAFAALSLSIVLDPVLRIAILMIFLVAGLRFGAGLLAYVGSGVAIYLISALVVQRVQKGIEPVKGATPLAVPLANVPDLDVRSVLPYALLAGMVAALFNIDLIVARIGMPQYEAGLYAAGAVLGRAIFFVGGAATIVMLPLVARRATHGEPHRHLLGQALGFVIAPSALCLLVYILAPRLLIDATYGSGYSELDPDLGFIAMAMFLFTAANVGISYLIALNRWRVILPVAAVLAAQVLLLITSHGSVREIALVQIAVMLALNITVWPLALRNDKKSRE